MNTKKIFSSAALAASLTLAAGAAFAWGCGAGPMMGYGPSCQVDPQGAYPGCQYGPNGMMRQGYPCWSYGPQGAQGARDFRPGFEQRKVYLRGALNLTDAQKPAFEAYFGAVDAYHQMKRPQGVQGQTRQDILNQRLAFQKTRVEALQKAIDARQELMKVLTPEQVKVFDAVESRTHARGPRGGFGPGHRGYHHGGYGMMYQQGVPAPQGQQQGGRL